MRRPAAVLVLSAMVPALLVVPTFGRSAADPHPVAPRLSTVQLTGVDAAAWRAEQAHPAASDSASTHAATDLQIEVPDPGGNPQRRQLAGLDVPRQRLG